MNERRSWCWGCLLIALAACGPDVADTNSGAGNTADRQNAPAAELAEISRDATGPEVVALQTKLKRYGYLPNAELAAEYPRWTPVVDEQPVEGSFDDVTERALRAYQRRYGLEQTGRADAVTQQQLGTARCSVPDNIQEADQHTKFSTRNGTTKTTIRWKTSGSLANQGVPDQRFVEVASWALWAWSTLVPITFTHTPNASDSSVDLLIRRGTTGLGSCCGDGRTITVASDQPFSSATPPHAGHFDLHRVLVHEIGHFLGLSHSSLPIAEAIMNPATPTGSVERMPQPDDRAGMATKWNTIDPTQIGIARDVGVSTNGDVWAITNIPFGHGYRIVKRVGSTWVETNPPGGAVSIAVAPSGWAWAVSDHNDIWAHHPDPNDSFGWHFIDHCARDIGVSGNDLPWIVGCTERTPGNPDDGYRVEHASFDGSWHWHLDPDPSMGASRISVDANGKPWVVAINGIVYRRRSDDISVANAWLQMGSIPATDIALGHDTMLHPDGTGERIGRAWIVSTTNVTGGKRIYVRNDQPVLNSGTPTPPRESGWVAIKGTGGNYISAGPSGLWVVDSAFGLWKQK